MVIYFLLFSLVEPSATLFQAGIPSDLLKRTIKLQVDVAVKIFHLIHHSIDFFGLIPCEFLSHYCFYIYFNHYLDYIYIYIFYKFFFKYLYLRVFLFAYSSFHIMTTSISKSYFGSQSNVNPY